MMAPELWRIGPFTLRTYTFLIDLAVLIGLGALTWQGWRSERRPTAWLDAGLVTLAGGAIAGRMGHVAMQWGYFSAHPDEIVRVWRGGIDWHSAMLGGLAGLALGCRLWRINWRQALEALALSLPLGATLSYAACLMGSCAHGREVASLAFYPPFVAAELPDLYGIIAPRLNSQLLGIVLGLAVLVVVSRLGRLTRRPGLRFWIALALLGLGTFGIGFTRGDAVPMIGSLRLDQALDLGMVAIGMIGAWDAAHRPIPL